MGDTDIPKQVGKIYRRRARLRATIIGELDNIGELYSGFVYVDAAINDVREALSLPPDVGTLLSDAERKYSRYAAEVRVVLREAARKYNLPGEEYDAIMARVFSGGHNN